MKPAFVIGDVHGHLDRLRELLEKAGIIKDNERIRRDVEVIQLGDLGHFGESTQRQDLQTLNWAPEWIDVMLWGNHDRACVDKNHVFKGYHPPKYATMEALKHMHPRFAYASNEYLLTHAGLAPDFAPMFRGLNTEGIAKAIEIMGPGSALVDGIGKSRGGFEPCGGILWRDDSEPVWADIKQVYGHSRGLIRKHGDAWCIDVGGIMDGNLAGIWLPEMRVVGVGPDAEIFENPYHSNGAH